VDIEPRTGNIDARLGAEAARDVTAGGTPRQRWLPRRGAEEAGRLSALMPVDVFGQPVDYDAIRLVADEHGLAIIEDACESLGATYKGRQAGTFGDSAVFAFYPNKQITTGEGGVIVTSDDRAAELMRSLRNQGRAPGDRWLQHTRLGYNYRIDEMSAALGLSQMQRLDELIDKRQRVASWYQDRLSALEGVETPSVDANTTRMSWFVYVIRVPATVRRDELAGRLEARGIDVRPYFLPIHLQPYMMERFGYRPGDFPNTEDAGRRGLALPFSSVLTESQVDHVCEALRQELGAA